MATTGSVDIFRYNPVTDQHDLILTLYKPLGLPDEFDLARDPDYSGSTMYIHTDKAKQTIIPVYNLGGISIPVTITLQDIPIQIDIGTYVENLQDDYGHAIDVYNNILAVGDRSFMQQVAYGSVSQITTGSCVDIYNLTVLNSNFFDGYVSTGSNFFATRVLPPSGEIPTGSFGYSVSINDEWLAVGSPNFSGSTSGSVHMFRRTVPGDPNIIDFNYFSTITGSRVQTGDLFGHSIHLNKQTGSYSGSLIVGCGRTSTTSSFAYYFEFNGTSWTEQWKFAHDLTPRNLPFFPVIPINQDPNYVVDGYSYSVALWEKDAVVGAPTDRIVYEYSGSQLYNEGAAYIYRRCEDESKGWYLVEKTYGDERILVNNKLGFSCDIWEDKIAIGSPKANLANFDTCYLQGSVWQNSYCYSNLQDYIQGQWLLYERNTSSADTTQWDLTNVYQKKKRFLSPYRAFGYDVAIADKSAVVGAPLIIMDNTRSFDIQDTGSISGNSSSLLDDFAGKAYIYNLKNLKDNFHVGNVFYRNGKIVLNTSGSVFDGIWFDPLNAYYNYEYELKFDNKQTLFEKQIACVIEPGEFNTSTNPTALVKETPTFDINGNGRFDWQDMDVILRYMQILNTRYSRNQTTDWSSSLLTTVDEISFYNFYSTRNSYYNTEQVYVSQSFFQLLNTFGTQKFDFNQDSKVDINDLNIFWKYCSKRLTQINYQTFITPSSQRRLFSDIVNYLDTLTQRNAAPEIKPEFLTFTSQSASDKTGSYLAPYVTTVGLYSGLDLVAVAKLGSPIKLTGEYPVNIMVKIDF